MEWLVKFVREEEGVTAVEYAIMVAAIAGVITAGVILVGGSTRSLFTKIDIAMGDLSSWI